MSHRFVQKTCAIVFFTIFAGSLHALPQPLILDVYENKTHFIDRYAKIFIDQEQQLSFKDVMQLENHEWHDYQPIAAKLPTGLVDYWLYFEIKNKSKTKKKYIYGLLNSLTSIARLYKLHKPDGIKITNTGTGIDPVHREMSHQYRLAFEIELEPEETAKLLVKFHHYGSRVNLSGFVQEEKSYYSFLQNDLMCKNLDLM